MSSGEGKCHTLGGIAKKGNTLQKRTKVTLKTKRAYGAKVDKLRVSLSAKKFRFEFTSQ